MKVFLILFSLLLATSGFAKMGYTGRLVRTNGVPVTGTSNLRFELFYSNATGTVIASQTINSVPLVNGVYTVELDFDGVGTFPAGHTGLKNVVDSTPAGHTLVIRVTDTTNSLTFDFQNILAVPKAFSAKHAESADGVSAGSVNFTGLDVMGACADGQVLTKNGTQIQCQSAVAGGEVNTISNAGGTGLVKAKIGVDTPVKGLTNTSDISLTSNLNDIQIGIGSTNGVNQLVRLDGAGALPAIDGSNLTGVAADNAASLCSPGEYLDGDGACYSIPSGSTYTAGTGISIATNVISANMTQIESGLATLCTTGELLVANIGGSFTCLDPSTIGDDLGNHTATQNIELDGNYLSGDGDNEGLFVDGSGNVGIGTATPTALFHIQGSSSRMKFINTANGTNTLTNSSPGLELITDGNQNQGTQKMGMGIKFMAGDNAFSTEPEKFVAGIFPVATEPYTSDTDGGSSLQFFTTANDPGVTSIPSVRMTIDESGSVGIGTTTPSSQFEVSGANSLVTLTNTDGSSNYNFLEVNSNLISNRSTSLVLKKSGNTEYAKIEFKTGHSGLASQIALGMDGSPRMVINGGVGPAGDLGNVGIAVTAPSEKLHVGGNIRATSLAGVGTRCLQTDANGVISATGAICGSGGGGEANTASNVGAGSGVFKQKSAADLEFKSLTATSDIALTNNTDDIQIGITTTNSANQLLRLDGSGALPALDGSNLTGIDPYSAGTGITISSNTVSANMSDISEGIADLCSNGEMFLVNGSGNFSCANPSTLGDNLGNHEASQNIDLGSHFISGDGTNEGLSVANNGIVSVTTTSVTQMSLDRTGDANVDDTADIGVGYWSSGDDYLWIGSSGSSRSFVHSLDSGRTGINTSGVKPGSILQIGNAVDADNFVLFGKRITASEINSPYLGQTSFNGTDNSFAIATASGTGKLSFFTGSHSTRFTTANRRMTVGADGKVNIGNGLTPSELLTVEGNIAVKEGSAPSATSDYGKLYVNSADSKLYFLDDGGTSFDLTSGGGSADNLGNHTATQNINADGFRIQNIATGNAGSPGLKFVNDPDTGFFRPSADKLGFTTGGTERVVIDSSGNVGIGSTSPSDQLHVRASGASINIESTSDFSEPSLSFNNTTASERKYFRLQSDGDLELRNSGNVAIADFTSTDVHLVPSGGGDVGIGTLSPTERLTVDGNINVTAGNDICITSGNCLSSVGSGETNTASNQGTAGVGVFLSKSSLDLQFKNINSNSTITVTNDAANNEIDLSVAAEGLLDTNLSGISSSCANGNVLVTNGLGSFSCQSASLGDIIDGGNSTGSTVVVGTNDSQNLYLETNGATRMAFDTAGNVGVGTTSPSGFETGTGQKTFHISGNGGTELHLQAGGASGGYKPAVSYSYSGTRVGYVRISRSTTSAIDGAMEFGTHDGTTLSERMRISKEGQVGIGTTNPTSLLHVETNGTSTPDIKIKNNGNTSAARTVNLDFAHSGGGSARISASRQSGNADGMNLKFFTETTAGGGLAEAMRIDEDGKVGIGTASPSQLLTVDGNIYATAGNDICIDGGNCLSSTGAGDILNGGNSEGATVTVGTNDAQAFALETNGTTRMSINSSGNIGMGTSNPSYSFDIQRGGDVAAISSGLSGSYGTRIANTETSGSTRGALLVTGASNSSTTTYFETGWANFVTGVFTSHLAISGRGDVGIGITPSTSTQKLEVNGRIVSHPNGTSSGNGGAIYLKELVANGTNYVAFRSPASLTSNIIWELPSTAGTTGQVLQKGASSTLVWATPSGGADNLGDHKATANIDLNGNWLSGDGGNEGVYVTAAGDVGVGITNPSKKLEVDGTFQSDDLTIDGTSPELVFRQSGTITGYMSAFSNVFRVNGRTGYSLALGSNNVNDRLVIDNDGEVGIGTTTPTENLQIVETNIGGSTSAEIVNSDTSAGSHAEFNALGGSTYTANQAYGNGYAYTISNAANGYSVGTYAASNLIFVTDSTARAVIDSSGRMGIGTSNPTAPLTVVQGSSDPNFVRYGGNPGFVFQRANGTEASKTTVASGNALGDLTYAGYDGANMITAARIRAVVDGTPGTNDMPGALLFLTTADGSSSSSERMRIDKDGNTGIGLNSPTSRLDVGGDIKATGDFVITQSNASSARVNAAVIDGYISDTTAGSEDTGLSISVLNNGSVDENYFFEGNEYYMYTTGYHRGNWNHFQRVGNNAFGPFIYGDKYRGTWSSRTAAQAGDDALNIVARGYDGSTSQEVASITLNIDENVTSSNSPGSIFFNTTPSGSTSVVNRMKIANNGNIGIGTSSPDHKLDINGDMLVGAQDHTGNLWDGNATVDGCQIGQGGWIACQRTSSFGSLFLTKSSGSGVLADFRVGTTIVGNIFTSGTTTTFNTTSDRRLKENFEPVDSALSTVNQIEVKNFNYIQDPENKMDGFIAQQLRDVVPYAVSGEEIPLEEDDENDDGLPDNPLLVDYSKVVPLAIKAIQELSQEIDRNQSMYQMMQSGVVEEQNRKIASIEESQQDIQEENNNLKVQVKKQEKKIESLEKRLERLEALMNK